MIERACLQVAQSLINIIPEKGSDSAPFISLALRQRQSDFGAGFAGPYLQRQFLACRNLCHRLVNLHTTHRQTHHEIDRRQSENCLFVKTPCQSSGIPSPFARKTNTRYNQYAATFC
jgi:hypothetical protein